MFQMFTVGCFSGAAFLAGLLLACTRKPDLFKLSVALLLMAGVASFWAVASINAEYAHQYHELSGKGDGL